MSDDASVLESVLTPAEVALMWGVAPGSVAYRLNRGSFAWRYTSGGRVLIDRASVVAVWGLPRCGEISVMGVIDMGR